MISLVTGKIGGGKTLHCVGLMLRHLAKGGTVVTNVDLVWEAVARLAKIRHRVEVRPEQLVRIDLVDSAEWHVGIPWGTSVLPVLVVLDEIHLFFNARDWAKTQQLHRGMLSFLSQSRKCCIDVVFIAQVATTLEKQFRVQCEWEFYCRSVKDIKIPGLGTLPFNFMLQVKKDVETDKPVSREFRAYDRALFPLYDTRAFLDAQMRTASETATRVEPFKLKRFPLIPRSFWISGLIGFALWIAASYLL